MSVIEVSLPDNVQKALDNVPGRQTKVHCGRCPATVKEARLQSLKEELIKATKTARRRTKLIRGFQAC